MLSGQILDQKALLVQRRQLRLNCIRPLVVFIQTSPWKFLDAGEICFNMKLFLSVITNLDSNGLPKYLSMDDQSRFAIGYYHQREDLYKTTTDKEKN